VKGLYTGKGAHKGEGAHRGKGATEINFKHDGSQTNFLLHLLANLSHFQNDGAATVECSTVVLLQIQLAILCF